MENFSTIYILDTNQNSREILEAYLKELDPCCSIHSYSNYAQGIDSITFYFKEDKVMFVGDFIFKDSIGRCDLSGGSINDMKKSIDIIKKYGNIFEKYISNKLMEKTEKGVRLTQKGILLSNEILCEFIDV